MAGQVARDEKKSNGLTNVVPRIVSYSFVTGENPGNEVEF